MLNPAPTRDNRESIRRRYPLSLPGDLSHLPGDSEHDCSPQGDMIPVKSKPHEIQWLLIKPGDTPVFFEGKPLLCKPLFNLTAHLVQTFLVPVEDHHIVGIADIIFRSQFLLDVEIDLVHKEVGQDLRQQDSDG